MKTNIPENNTRHILLPASEWADDECHFMLASCNAKRLVISTMSKSLVTRLKVYKSWNNKDLVYSGESLKKAIEVYNSL